MAGVGQILSRHGAVIASVLFHGAALALLVLKLTPPSLTAPANAETPSIAVEIITAPTPLPASVFTTAALPPPPPEPQPAVVEESPPLIESVVAEEIAPPPPPEVERKKERPPRPERVRQRPRPEPAETRELPMETPQTVAQPAPPSRAPVAQQTALAAPAGRAGPPPDYVALLHQALERKKEYPRAARQQRQQGRAMLRFAIDRGGNVLSYRIEKSSGYEVLDREVVAMIQRASPLPPIPAEMAADRLEVVVPIPFAIR
jgi:protein TonB